MQTIIENILEYANLGSDLIMPITVLLFIIVSAIIAKSSDFIFTVIFKKAVNKTNTTLDNELVEVLHKPIYYSIFFTGVVLSIDIITALPDSFDYIFRGIFKSITIFFKVVLYSPKGYENNFGE